MAYDFASVFALLNNWTQKYSSRLILGLSGGGDSFALLQICRLWLLTPQAKADNAQIFPVIIDHNIANDSAEIAEFARMQAVEMGFVPMVLRITNKITTSIEENARIERFRLLKQAAIDKNAGGILIAHNHGDRIETLLFRLLRGSDIFGMCGIRRESLYEFNGTEGVILRPLLQFKRDELRDICRQNHIEFHNDPANDSLDYSRVRLRKWLLQNKINEDALIKISDYTNQIRGFYERQCIDFINNYCISGTNFILLDLNKFNHKNDELKAFIIGKTLQAVGNSDYQPKRDKIRNLLVKLNGDFKGATLNHCAIKLKRGQLQIIPAPPRKNSSPTFLSHDNVLKSDIAKRIRILCNIKSAQ